MPPALPGSNCPIFILGRDIKKAGSEPCPLPVLRSVQKKFTDFLHEIVGEFQSALVAASAEERREEGFIFAQGVGRIQPWQALLRELGAATLEYGLFVLLHLFAASLAFGGRQSVDLLEFRPREYAGYGPAVHDQTFILRLGDSVDALLVVAGVEAAASVPRRDQRRGAVLRKEEAEQGRLIQTAGKAETAVLP